MSTHEPYVTALNGKFPGVSRAFHKLSPELTPAWLERTLATASQHGATPLSEPQLLDRLNAARLAIKRQLTVEDTSPCCWRPNDLQAWARSKVVSALKE